MIYIESELTLLLFVSAFLCGLALTFDQPLATAVSQRSLTALVSTSQAPLAIT
jgi:hypothetical protein